MAPVPDAAASSIERLRSLVSSLGEHITRSLLSTTSNSQPHALSRRDAQTQGTGATAPDNIPNQVVFALFGLIGAGFVITGIWFFFWARNGGFHFREGDWEDYKSTVLRRKGPNGTTLSGATASTDLGGGSIVGRRQRQARYKDVDFESSIGTASEMSEIAAGREGLVHDMKEKSRKQKKKKSSKRGSREKPADEESVISGTTFTEDQHGNDDHDLGAKDVVRAYRHEKPARVGGLNRAPDGSAFEGSSHDSHSDLLSNRERTPTNTPTKKSRNDRYTGGTAGIRKVESTSHKTSGTGFWGSRRGGGEGATSVGADGTEDRIKSEARKLQEKAFAAGFGSSNGSGRRDFSYTAGDDGTSATATSTTGSVTADEERRARRQSRHARRGNANSVPGSYVDSEVGGRESVVGSAVGSEVSGSGDGDGGTKSYPHTIPGLSEYAEERRRAREKERGTGGKTGERSGGWRRS